MLNRMLLFAQIRGQRGHVVAPALQFDVMPLFDAVHADMDLGTRRRGARHFFAQEEVGITAKMLGGIDGIVIGYRHQIHSPPLQSFDKRLPDRCSSRGRTDGIRECCTCPNGAYGRADRTACPFVYLLYVTVS